MSQVRFREKLAFLGATQWGFITGPRSSDMLSAPFGNLNQAHSSSKSFSNTISRLHTLLYHGLHCPASCCFLLAGFWSLLHSTELEQPFKTRENPGSWRYWRAGGGEWNWKVEKTWRGKSRKKARSSQQWMLSLRKQNKYFSHWLDSDLDKEKSTMSPLHNLV